MASSSYVIRGGLEGRERLRIVARVMWPTTSALLSRVAIAPTARCLDLGCGGGDVTIELARRTAQGYAVGTDLDEVKLELARAEAARAGVGNVEFRLGDVFDPPADDEQFDVVYARFLLTHLPDPSAGLTSMCARVAPGGVVVVEDIDFSGHFCHPHSAAFWRYVELYTEAVRARGCDPNIGPRLPTLLSQAGLEARGMNVVQPAGFSGEVKVIGPITLEAIADSVLAAGLATPQQLAATIDELYAFAEADDTVISVPRIVQAWGRRAN